MSGSKHPTLADASHATDDMPRRDGPPGAAPAATLLTGALLTACGSGAHPGPPPPPPGHPPDHPPGMTLAAGQAARFLAQASMGATSAEIARVQSVGFAAWLDEQFAMPASGTRWDWLIAHGYGTPEFRVGEGGADACQWIKLLSSPDTLRQRVTLALSEIVVGAVDGFIGSGWRAFSAAAYLDLLEANAFGNYRTLLQQVTLSAPMGEFLTYRNNTKFNPVTGSTPDENFAREVMQLFTIGLVELELDGSATLTNGEPTESYTQDDITGLARVFTGWGYDLTGTSTDTPDFKRRSMIQNPARHESGPKTFLGTTIPAGTDGLASLTLALDTLFAHPNVAPFISRQLIQRLVCSNPDGAYIRRVATVFNNDGAGVKGNLKAVVRAILLDDEARADAALANPRFGKLREPILRFCAWARAFHATSPSGKWAIGDTSDPATRLGQSPLRSPTVFNFFHPGYVPPNSAIGTAGMVAPEFQITNESTVVGYLNFMQTVISRGVGDVKADYTPVLSMAASSQALLDHINLVLAAGELTAPTLALIRNAVDSMPADTDAARLDRIHAALVMTMAAPDFIVQK